MSVKNTISALLAVLCILFLGCATTDAPARPSRASAVQRTELGEFPAYELLRSAEAAYADGVVHNMKRDWETARAMFDEALRLIAQIDVIDDEDLSARIDLLLREVAYDYRFALAHTDSLEATAAPIVLSAALEGLASSEYTKQRLSELAGDLPKVLRGEFDIPVVWNDRVKEKIIYFQTRAREPFSEWLRRSGRYTPMMKEILAEKGLPLDLAYLPLIESGYAPTAYSWAHAMGLWQFIKSTGRIFGLEVNWWLDERRDPVKATYAAADYFTSLYRKFGDWELCLAAYNCGDGRVARSIASQGTSSYWELKLPNETMNYVPLYFAALIIAKDPAAYGFDVEYYPPYEYETITVTQPTNLELIAKCTDTSLAFIKAINPEVMRYCTPPDATHYQVRVPRGKAGSFAERYAAVPESEKTVWAKHKVKKGETLSEIALHYGTSAAQLTEANNLRNAHQLRIGQELVIPVAPSTARAMADRGTPATPAAPSGAPSSVTNYYSVRKGDTLSGIAQRNGVALDELLLANSLKRGSVITPGMRLKIPVGKKATTYTVASGDTPSTIAARFGVTTNELLEWNKLDRNSTIYPGQKLTVLVGESQRQPMGKIVHTVQSGESLWAIARRYNVHVSNIVEWNNLSNNQVTLQIGQKLEIIGTSPEMQGGYTENRKRIVYTVKKGDNLGKIAREYSVTVEAVQRWNDKKDTKLQIGDKLTIYTDDPSAVDVGPIREVVHTVKSGETLSGIAQKYGTTVSDIRNANSKKNDRITPGEKLKITTTSSPPVAHQRKAVVHSVKPGETLGHIATAYGVRVADIKEWNNKKSDIIRPGEQLEIFGASSPVVTESAQARTVRHTVQAGETMSELAVRYAVDVADIMRWNEKKNSSLRIGEILEIRTREAGGAFGGGPRFVTHRVESGDTVWGIAKRYGTTPDAILKSNGNINPNSLRIGDVLKIKVE
ncbi:MAG TPA: LysM peptidoglycan-binding domain-containing protein [candidate division Zixibacteria bacterium]|nr:LysM peptidoglycan-binding domain-containing protein [candidate division Zixibacteria bacterium]